jgi:hypothetical protein
MSTKQTTKKQSIVIGYYDEDAKQSCLKGLTMEEKQLFQAIVLKQFEKGIKIKISYRELDFSDSFACI